MLLRQWDGDLFEDIETAEEMIEDWSHSDNIPINWKAMVDRCLERDPQKRPTLKDLEQFWISVLKEMEMVEY